MRGRAAVGFGNGPGISPYTLGQITGSETTTLTVGQMPAHNHLVAANGNVQSPSGADLAQSVDRQRNAVDTYSTPFSNIQPVLGLNYIIALQGIFPSRQ
ncbi:MAG: phage tail protein [Methylocella sp.]